MRGFGALLFFLGFAAMSPATVWAQKWGDMGLCQSMNITMCNSFEGGTCGKSWVSTFDGDSTFWSMALHLKCSCTGGIFYFGPCSVVVRMPSSNAPLLPSEPPLCPARASGSDINVDAQTVAEAIPIVGTDFSLNYTSLRAQSRQVDYKLVQPVSDEAASVTFNAVDLTLFGSVVDSQNVTNDRDHLYEWLWDGLDGLGQPALASVQASLEIDPNNGNTPFTLIKNVGTLKAKLLGFGGWMPSHYHFFDVLKGELHKGDGSIRVVKPMVLGSGNLLVPDIKGLEVYEFNSSGFHLYTRTPLTGTAIRTFTHTGYSGASFLTSIQEPFGRSTTFTRNGSGVLTSITAPDGAVTAITVSGGLLMSVTNPNSETHAMTYKSSTDLLETFEKPGGQENTFSYDAEGRIVTDSHSGGYLFDLVKTINASDSYTVTHSTSLGRVMSTTVTSNRRGSSGSYSRTTSFPSGASHTVSEKASSTTSVSGGLTYREEQQNDPRFGASLRIPSLSSINGSYRQIFYAESVTLGTPSDPFSISLLTRTSTMNGQSTVTEYDGANHAFTTTSPEGRVRAMEIDVYERPVSEQWATDTAVVYGYTYDKLTSVTQGARTTSFAYSGVTGLLTSVTNDLSQVTAYAYDSARRIRYVTLPDARVIEYTYDANGNVATVTPPGRSPHGFSLNGHELLEEYQPPALGSPLVVNTLYAYNDDKQLTQITRPDSQSVVFTYGTTSGVLGSITTPDGTYSYGFDPSSGRVNYAAAPGSISTSRNFTGGRLFIESGWDGFASYSSFSQVNSLRQISSETVYPSLGSSVTVDYAYDNDELLTRAGDLSLTRAAGTGRVSATELGDLSDQWTYNSFGELLTYTFKHDATTLYSYTLTRDDLGRVDTRSETVLGTTNAFGYGYDSSGRLGTVSKNASSHSAYAYDDNNNRTSGMTGGVSFTSVFDAQDRLTGRNLFTYTYTANGELESKTNTLTSEVWVYVYDVLGHLKSVTLPNADVISYKADGFQRRVLRKLNGTVTSRYQYFGDKLVGELDASGAFKGRFVYGVQAHVPDYMVVGSDNYRLVKDHLGSVRMVVKADDGTVVQKIDYDELGRVLSDTNPGFQPFGFAGGLYDPATGLVRFGARDYDPETGRWTSKDPILFEGGDTNLYGYVLNDPINLIDPTGLTQAQIDNARNWLRTNNPSLTNGMDNWSINDGWLPYQGGLTLPGNRIRINTCGMDDADVVDAVSHELMHARDGFWNTILGMGRDHNSIYDAAARLGNQYRNK